jgi:hypothetical protein
MRICILATNENVEAVRLSAKEKIPELAPFPLLTIPASPTGELPATHWYCSFLASQEMTDRLMAIKTLSEMEITNNTKRILEEKGLKTIKAR